MATQTISNEQLDRLEEAVIDHGVNCVRCPPMEMVCRLTLDIAGVRPLLSTAQPPETTHRLYRTVAGLSVLLADELMVLGDTHAANAWYGTARTAAGHTNDHALTAMVLTLAALLPLYWGSPRQAAAMALQAMQVAKDAPGTATIMAPSVRALALTQSGELDAGEKAIATARDIFGQRADSVHVDSVFSFSERRFHFYEGKTLRRHGRRPEALRTFDHALAMYPTDLPGDPPSSDWNASPPWSSPETRGPLSNWPRQHSPDCHPTMVPTSFSKPATT